VVTSARRLELLGSAVSYALAGAGRVLPPQMSCSTPCPGWDLDMLLDHLSDSIAVLTETIVGPATGYRELDPDPVARLRGQAAGLLDACTAAGPSGRRITVGGRELTENMVAVTAAVEIAVHGWDISVTCGTCQPVPPGLAAVLLPIAPLLITSATRPGLFADPVQLPGPACPGDQLVAFLGRRPRPNRASG
jgi:uncharacterized protein (TIGR03086 family)